MITWDDQARERPVVRLSRVTVGVAFAISLHAGLLAATTLNWKNEQADEAITGAIAFELAPMPVTSEGDADQPDSTDSPETPPLEQAADEAPMPAPPPVEMPRLDPAPLVDNPEVTLPPPPIELVQRAQTEFDAQPQLTAEQEPQDELKSAIADAVRQAIDRGEPAPSVAPSKAAVASQSTQQTAPEVPTAEVTAAPKEGMSEADEKAVATWRARLTAHIFRQKRYPKEARLKHAQGEVKVAFAVDRNGVVTAVRIAVSSGSSALDDAAIEMIERASPLPMPPEATGPTNYQLVLPVSFQLK